MHRRSVFPTPVMPGMVPNQVVDTEIGPLDQMLVRCARKSQKAKKKNMHWKDSEIVSTAATSQRYQTPRRRDWPVSATCPDAWLFGCSCCTHPICSGISKKAKVAVEVTLMTYRPAVAGILAREIERR